MQSVVQSIIRLRCVIMGLLVVMWGDGEQLSKGGRGRHGDVQDRTFMLAP